MQTERRETLTVMSHDPAHTIEVNVETAYLADQSDPDAARYAFAYTITLRNQGSVGAKLISRHWVITDADGKTQEVRGMGVVGEQPYLEPGKSYRYTSGTLLDTPVGSMYGTYQMVGDDGVTFDAEIPVFTLSLPHTLH